jgi:hypothetical protein
MLPACGGGNGCGADSIEVHQVTNIAATATALAGGQPSPLAGRNRLPASIALRHIRVVTRRIGAVIPSLRGIGLAIVIVAIVRIIIVSVGIHAAEEEASAAVAALVEIPAPVAETIVPLTETAVETGEATVEAAKSAAVETAAPAAMRPGIGEVWLTESGPAQQGGCDSQSPSYPGPGSVFT